MKITKLLQGGVFLSQTDYQVPDLLHDVLRWEKEFSPTVSYLEKPTGLFLGIDSNLRYGYRCTPLDSVVLATTGGDGIHYAFLTDFGSIQDLEKTPIIRISPMDFGDCVRLVARNLHDFLSIQFNDTLILLNEYASEEAFLTHKQEESEDKTTNYFNHKRWLEEQAIAARVAQEMFQLPTITHPYQYIHQLRKEREEQIVLTTKDTLGVLPLLRGNSVPDHPWVNHEIPYAIDEIKDFFTSAPLETKLAFIRDYQAESVEDAASLDFLCEELIKMGFKQEAMRLQYFMKG